MSKIRLDNYRDGRDYGKIVAAVGRVLARQRYVSPIEVFVEMGLLMADDVVRWKRGGVPYLERVIRCNLSRAGRILRVLRFHAHDLNLKPSLTCYHQRKGDRPLRFSKSGEHLIEEAYSRHFVVVGKRNPFAPADAPAAACSGLGDFEPHEKLGIGPRQDAEGVLPGDAGIGDGDPTGRLQGRAPLGPVANSQRPISNFQGKRISVPVRLPAHFAPETLAQFRLKGRE